MYVRVYRLIDFNNKQVRIFAHLSNQILVQNHKWFLKNVLYFAFYDV